MVSYDTRLRLAKFDGADGRFTQVQLTLDEARAIADVLGLPFTVDGEAVTP